MAHYSLSTLAKNDNYTIDSWPIQFTDATESFLWLRRTLGFTSRTECDIHKAAQIMLRHILNRLDATYHKQLLDIIFWTDEAFIYDEDILAVQGITMTTWLERRGSCEIHRECCRCGRSVVQQFSPQQRKIVSRIVLSEGKLPVWCQPCALADAQMMADYFSNLMQEGSAPPGYICAVALDSFDAQKTDLRSMPYHEYLKTPQWQQIRKRKLEQADHRCELCFSTEHLHVHHKTYERRGAELDTDLIVLCADCHARFHDKLPR